MTASATRKRRNGKKIPVLLRLPPKTIEAIDAIVVQLQESQPGLGQTRAGLCHLFVEASLYAYERSGILPMLDPPAVK